jgi:glycosyltransferase involved in cell wall biosynthesis
MRQAAAVFAHAEPAREQLARTFRIPESRIEVIPFGDHSVTFGSPMPRDEARRILDLSPLEKICLMFGTVSPYKGIVEVVRTWREAHVPHRLVVVGPVIFQDYADEVRAAAGNAPDIDLRLSPDWLDDEALRTWLSAADCVIFNYKKIFTSGAGGLARSYGVPSVLPLSADTLDLGEPHEHVVRFESVQGDFREAIERALATPCDYAKAQEWRQRTSWDEVAAHTVRTYQKIVRAGPECRRTTKALETP